MASKSVLKRRKPRVENSNKNNSDIAGFIVLQLRFIEHSPVIHYLYVKSHLVRDKHPSKPAGRTLFVINVPPYLSEHHFKVLFKECGDIVKVYFHDKPNSGEPVESVSQFFKNEVNIPQSYKVAYVVFHDQEGLTNALKLSNNSEALLLSLRETKTLTGIEKWGALCLQKPPDVDKLQKEIDEFMLEYDNKVETEKNKAKAADGVADDEGWITVTKHGKRPFTPRTEATESKIQKREKKKRSKKQLLNFYTFQVRQSKMEHIAQLRKKFEEDKKRIELMKSSRKFKPY